MNPTFRLVRLCLPLLVWSVPAAAADTTSCTRLDIHEIGAERLGWLESHPGASAWVEIDDLLFACGSAAVLDELVDLAGQPAGPRWTGLDPEILYLVRAPHPRQLAAAAGVDVLGRSGPWTVVAAEEAWVAEELALGRWPGVDTHGSGERGAEHEGCQRPAVLPFEGRRVLVRQAANGRLPGAGPEATLGGGPFPPAVAEAVAAIDGGRWFQATSILAGWNRYTHGSQIHEARDWLVDQFEALGLAVTTPSFQVGGTTAYNVLARYDGTSRPDDWYLVGGHYDATSENPFQAAPGAEDNASGCAGVLELARAVIPLDPEATILFLCYSGEEQGLYGSNDHAADLVSAGDAAKVRLVLTMDMIAYTGDADLDVLLETNSAQAAVLNRFVDAAAAFTDLRSVTSTFAFGSDHVPYLERGLPAMLAIENDWDSYPSYHRTSDLPGLLTIAMGEGILRMNAAVLAEGVGVTSASRIFYDGFESGDVGVWNGTP